MITGKYVKQGKIYTGGKKTQKQKPHDVFFPLSSFVMHGTKAERGFKDGVLDTSALLIG